jgi:NUMOD4 motif-containing protein
MPPEQEMWRPIPGYEGRYEASTEGRVRSLGFYVSMNHASGKLVRFWKAGRVFRPTPVSSGHLHVTLVDDHGVQSKHSVHRLVLLAHIGPPPPNKPFGLHQDDNPANNRLTNLYWGDRPDNSFDSVRNGTHVQASKFTCSLGHQLIEPNLVPSTSARGFRGCLACKLTQANHNHDAKLRAAGRERTRYNRGKDGFQRRAGESWEDEAHRRYQHIMQAHRTAPPQPPTSQPEANSQ